jgi:hypothetical protein
MLSEATCFEYIINWPTKYLQPEGVLDQTFESDMHISEYEALIGEFNFNYVVRNFSSLIRPLSYLCKMSECK